MFVCYSNIKVKYKLKYNNIGNHMIEYTSIFLTLKLKAPAKYEKA